MYDVVDDLKSMDDGIPLGLLVNYCEIGTLINATKL